MSRDYSPNSVFKFCPKCGNDGFISDSEKLLVCSKCGFRYYINMSAAVAAIIHNDKNEILFTIRKHDPAAGKLDLPGGFVDLGETAENAVIREVFEELNLEITEMNFVGTFTNKYVYGGLEYQTLDLVFDCNVNSFTTIKAADDVSGYVFKNPTTVSPDEIGLDSIREIVRTVAEK